MVGYHFEPIPFQVAPHFPNSPYDGQTLFFRCRVIALRGCESTAGVRDDSLLALDILRQDCSSPTSLASVCNTNVLSKSGHPNTGAVVNLPFTSSSAFCCAGPHAHFRPFFNRAVIGCTMVSIAVIVYDNSAFTRTDGHG